MPLLARLRRPAARQRLRDSLDDARRARDARLRARLDGGLAPRGPSPAEGRDELLVLGRGTVLVDTPGGPVEVPDAPLAVRADHGVVVHAPPRLARAVADAYRRQLDDRYGARRRVGVASVDGDGDADEDAGGSPSPLRADVWIGPDGTAFARTPTEARGRWTPLELHL